MTNSRRFKTPSLYSFFWIISGLTLLVWLLRGLGILTFMPGAVLWILLFVSIAVGVLGTLQRR